VHRVELPDTYYAKTPDGAYITCQVLGDGPIECELIDGKMGEITVTIGARISQTVKDLVAGSGLSLEDAGEHELKGVPGSWRLYRVAG
jgi:hypothetical protein